MTHLAFRRDLDDLSLILEFAQSMGTEENLCLLYILTFCDLKAVSQDALTKWKDSLLEYLFIRTRSVLIKRDFSKENIGEISAKLMENVKILAHDEFSDEEIAHFFNIMPPRYFLTASAVTILDHLDMMRQFQEAPIIFQRRELEKEDLTEWTLITLDTPGLFSKICGILAANGVSISEVYLNTSSEGKHLHIFKVQTAQGTMIRNPEKWETIEKNVKDVLQGTVQLQDLLGNRLRPSLLKPKTARSFPTKVVIHNDLSPFYTIIDIYAHDRVGLLYHITSALTALGLYVDLSKIATKVDQVTDTFYVRDIFGQKVISEKRIEIIRRTLFKVIDDVNGGG
jgi:[protein-PII] uridylyltransferase